MLAGICDFFVTFYFSNRPFLNINDFINDYLNPPLTQIKNKYYEIEKELLDQSIEKLNNLDNFSSIIENDLDLESKISKINECIKDFKSDISEIIDFLFEDVDQYYCQVAFFKIIEGQEHLDKNNKIKLCNSSLFFLKNETFRRLKEKDNELNFNISKYLCIYFTISGFLCIYLRRKVVLGMVYVVIFRI